MSCKFQSRVSACTLDGYCRHPQSSEDRSLSHCSQCDRAGFRLTAATNYPVFLMLCSFTKLVPPQRYSLKHWVASAHKHNPIVQSRVLSLATAIERLARRFLSRSCGVTPPVNFAVVDTVSLRIEGFAWTMTVTAATSFFWHRKITHKL